MPYVTRGASRLYYELHGRTPGAGPALVLAHGVGGNHASWYQQIESLADRYTVLVFDARGFGNSTDAEGLGRAGFVDDLAVVMDEAGLARAVLVGQSMGGGTCLAFTCRHPQRVQALVLADTLMGFALEGAVAERLKQVEAATRDLSQAERVVGATFRTRHPALTRLYLELASFNAVNVRTLAGVEERFSPQALGQIGVPVLFVVGAEDVLFPPDLVQAVQAEVPGAAFCMIDGAGHSAYFETPTIFDHVLVRFVEALVP